RGDPARIYEDLQQALEMTLWSKRAHWLFCIIGRSIHHTAVHLTSPSNCSALTGSHSSEQLTQKSCERGGMSDLSPPLHHYSDQLSSLLCIWEIRAIVSQGL
uniref:Uncharacterized protein n=1 Tax=Acanthochromis polyacanthus TaxID=80966 RepID=A0A3Q1HU45_9TELE